jgi:uncharacterized protein (TIGR02001 family)
MNKPTTLSLVAALLALTTVPSFAQTAPASPWSLTGNAGLFSDYRFRGISQTNKKPAFQGGFDVAHSSGLYAGNWNSNIDSAYYGGSNLEMDFYGGYKATYGDFSYDVGVLYYYYPGSSPKIDNTELYVAGGWGPLTVKYSYAISDFFGLANSDGAFYLDGAVTYPLAQGFALVGHLGYQGNLKGGAKISEIGGGTADSITDWKIGVTYDASGWILGASYIGTNRDIANVSRDPNRNLSNDTVVLSVSKSF